MRVFQGLLGCWAKNEHKEEYGNKANMQGQPTISEWYAVLPSQSASPLSFPTFAYLSFSVLCPSGARPCCISFAAPPLNIQRLTPQAHLGKAESHTHQSQALLFLGLFLQTVSSFNCWKLPVSLYRYTLSIHVSSNWVTSTRWLFVMLVSACTLLYVSVNWGFLWSLELQRES